MNHDPNIIGYRRGVRQSWPVYRYPPVRYPLAVGGACPPHAPLRPVRYKGQIGYSCMEPGALGALSFNITETPSETDKKQTAALVVAGVLLGGVVYHLLRKGKRS